MKTADFTYHAPTNLQDALAILAQVAPQDGRVLAGGQSLVPTMAYRLARPAHLVDINKVAGLDKLEVRHGELCIGATVRHAAFHRPAVDGPLGALLADVVQHISHYAVRFRGTFCGSLAFADPASEWCVVAQALGAQLVAASTRGTRLIPASQFLQGLMTTALAEDEILIEARLPLLPPDTRFGFVEFNRRAGDFAIAMVLAVFRIVGGRIADPRIAVGGAEPHARRIAEAEAALAGQAPSPEMFAAAAQAAAAAIDPMEDASTDGAYRRDLVRVLTRRALDRGLR
jgi:carbon-monoxide dehydrogenase medium subunit